MRSKRVLVWLCVVGIVLSTAAVAEARRRRVVRATTDVMIEDVSQSGNVSGRILSSKDACVGNRTISVSRNGQTVGSDASTDSGNWHVNGPMPMNGDQYLAEVTSSTIRKPSGRRIICSSASDTFGYSSSNPNPNPNPDPIPGPSHTLNLDVGGEGFGTITSNPAGLSCRDDGPTSGTCSANFPQGSSVTLTAVADQGNVFAGWGGDCAFRGSQSTCTLTMSSTRNVSATFLFA